MVYWIRDENGNELSPGLYAAELQKTKQEPVLPPPLVDTIHVYKHRFDKNYTKGDYKAVEVQVKEGKKLVWKPLFDYFVPVEGKANKGKYDIYGIAKYVHDHLMDIWWAIK